MKTYRIATVPGDGIGKEVVPAGRQVLEALGGGSFRFEFENFDWGGDYFRQHGVMMPENGLDSSARQRRHSVRLRRRPAYSRPHHAVGSAAEDLPGARSIRQRAPDAHSSRHRCDRSSAARPEDLNWVIVRENTEGEYSGVGGRVHQGHPIEVATDLSLMTRAGVERIHRFAFRLAQSRPRKLLTVITKSNAQRHAMVMWDEIAAQIAAGIS